MSDGINAECGESSGPVMLLVNWRESYAKRCVKSNCSYQCQQREEPWYAFPKCHLCKPILSPSFWRLTCICANVSSRLSGNYLTNHRCSLKGNVLPPQPLLRLDLPDLRCNRPVSIIFHMLLCRVAAAPFPISGLFECWSSRKALEPTPAFTRCKGEFPRRWQFTLPERVMVQVSRKR